MKTYLAVLTCLVLIVFVLGVVEKWNGELPRLTGNGTIPFLDVSAQVK